MAIQVVGGQCSLCGKPMLEGEKTVMFSPFVSNEADPLWKFSDGAFHEATEQRPPARRRCRVCGEAIISPDDYAPFGHLTDDPDHPLHRLNHATFHRSCLQRWPELDAVHEQAAEQLKSGAWKGRGIQWLVDALKDAQTARDAAPDSKPRDRGSPPALRDEGRIRGSCRRVGGG